MRIFSGSRVLACAAVLAGAPLATLAFEGTASAVDFPGAAVSCTKLEGTTQSGIEFAEPEQLHRRADRRQRPHRQLHAEWR